MKRKAFLVAGDSWGLQQATAGLLLEENHEGRWMITGNHWQTFQPAGQRRGRPQPNPALPIVSQPSLMSQSTPCTVYLYKNLCQLCRFLLSKDNFCWALSPKCYGANFNVLVIKW